MSIVSVIVFCNINIYLFIGCCFFIPLGLIARPKGRGFFIEPIANLTYLRARLIQSKKKKMLVEEIASVFEKESIGHIHDIECNKIALNSINYRYDIQTKWRST
ncbi:MAG: hypothetical protein LBG43_03850 [Treponema sp.]|jgi:hypothetical protein|nr:hypothetical protein [Treponema sp.]